MTEQQHIVFFTGAGISKASGLDTFRDAGGLWSRFDVNEYASKEALLKDPEKVLKFYQQRKEQIQRVQPNSAHQMISELQKSRFRVSVVTQNIDDLHERAGSVGVTHVHGNIMYTRPSDDSGPPTYNDCPLKYSPSLNTKGEMVFERPDVVLFGEAVKDFDKAMDITQSADLFVIVGTSMTVQPAASLLLAVPFDCQVVYIDPDPDIEKGINLHVLPETAEEGLRILTEELLPQ